MKLGVSGQGSFIGFYEVSFSGMNDFVIGEFFEGMQDGIVEEGFILDDNFVFQLCWISKFNDFV